MFSLRCRGRLPHQFRNCIFKVLHGKLGANKGLGEAPKSYTRKEHESATNPIAKRGQGGTSSLFVCPLQGQGTASLVGFGATPQQFRVKPTQRKKSTRRRQRSVPASNFARPQTRPQAALPPRFREEPFLRRHRTAGRCLNPTASCSFCVSRRFFYSTFLFFVGMC